MKKLTLFLLLLIVPILSKASHNRAGEITYKQIGALTYEVTVTTYTKASSLPADRDSLEVFWGDGSSDFVVRSNGNGTVLNNDTKENHYVGTHTYATINNYTVSMTDPNRNSGILNVNPPNSDQVLFYLEAKIWIQSTGTNDSPTFLQKPIDVSYVNQSFVYCTNHIDKEGDSLVYALVTPKQGVNTPVSNYSFPNNIGSPSHFLSIDAATGLLTWTEPRVAGEYVITILLKEYRNGVLIGSIVRDMQITIFPMGNRPPNFNDTTSAFYELMPGQSIQFTLSATDIDGDNIQLSATGFPLEKTANFTAPTNNMNSTISGNFSWTPTTADVRRHPYQMVFRVEDDAEGTYGGVFYKVVQIKVNFPVSTKQIDNIASIKLFPNPASNQLIVDFQKPVFENTPIRLFNSSGILVRNLILNKGQQTLQINVSDLATGMYIFNVHQEGMVKNRRFVITR